MIVANNTALIKPVSALCPMNCSYCFYNDIANHRETFSYPKMTESTLDLIINRYTANASESTTFLFQGGEPLMAGLNFFRHYKISVQAIINKRPDFKVFSSLQTSGILITQEFARLFKEMNFLIGISLDGTEAIHNENRKLKNGNGSFKKVMHGISLLKENNVDFNILTVINKTNVTKAATLWNFFKEEDIKFLQFIPALASIEKPGCLVSSDEYADFMLNIFDLWSKDLFAGHYVSVRFIDDLFAKLTHKAVTSCDMQGHCTNQNVIEADGSIYPCDFYVLDKYRLGSVFDLKNPDNSVILNEFIKGVPVASQCASCNLFNLCKGGCKRYREEDNSAFLCKTYKSLFTKRAATIQKVLNLLT